MAGGQRSLISKITTGTITIADNATTATAAVVVSNLANCELTWGGYRSNVATGWSSFNTSQLLLSVELTNATTVTAKKVGTFGPAAESYFVVYTLIEYVPGVIKSSGRGTITIAISTTSNTATPSPAVNTAKTKVYTTGMRTTGTAAEQVGALVADLVLTNSTTITSTRGVGSATCTTSVDYHYIEFY